MVARVGLFQPGRVGQQDVRTSAPFRDQHGDGLLPLSGKLRRFWQVLRPRDIRVTLGQNGGKLSRRCLKRLLVNARREPRLNRSPLHVPSPPHQHAQRRAYGACPAVPVPGRPWSSQIHGQPPCLPTVARTRSAARSCRWRERHHRGASPRTRGNPCQPKRLQRENVSGSPLPSRGSEAGRHPATTDRKKARRLCPPSTSSTRQ